MTLDLAEPAPANPAQGRIGGGPPVGVLDIGSNSVRLVVYERHCRALTPLYNEKAACALGRGVAKTGELAPDSVERALTAIRRFALVAELNHAASVHVLATSAVREASNCEDFVAAVEQIMGVKPRVLSGREEAHFAAMGVVSGMPGQAGVVGDLGGGSLELAVVGDARDVSGETLALGAIRLQDDSENSPKKAQRIARERLAEAEALQSLDHKVFSAIGGTWRALAKLHQMQTKYPLHLVQHYRAEAGEIAALCSAVIAGEVGPKEIPGFELLSSNRRDLLPYGCAVMAEVLKAGEFSHVQFSALGLREGYLFELLPEPERRLDPLIEACAELSTLRSRSPEHAADLEAFTSGLIAALGSAEDTEQRRLRHAAGLLSDIGWRGHPDYRGEQAVDMVAYGSFIGVDHPGRAFLAQTLAVRYMGLKQQSISQDVLALCPAEWVERARLLGACFRVAYLLSAARPGVLPQIGWAVRDKTLQLVLPQGLAFLAAERMVKRLEQLAGEVSMTAEVVISG
ncbi:MAG TPA: Ppx/GppA family phosphatase [Devosiaceae bacterium]|nr:Ppx/GppA family phosphatase [Devosiaceae bacterium]